MARTRFKCQVITNLCILLLCLDTVKSLPIRLPILETTDRPYPDIAQETIETVNTFTKETKTLQEKPVNRTLATDDASLVRQTIRPGQEARSYVIEIKRNGNNFEGRAVIEVRLTQATMNNPLFFRLTELTVSRVQVGAVTIVNAVDTPYSLINQGLEIRPTQAATTYFVIIEYTATIRRNGIGLYLGQYDDTDYLAMNLHPTNARRVFPCMDDPNISTITSFSFVDMQYNSIVTNSMLEVNSQTSFRPLEGPSHLWGMIAHNFENINRPAQNVLLYARAGVTNQEAQASIAISQYYNALNTWTEKPYTGIILNQDSNMHVVALPDVSTDWYALSTVCIWEPYMLMETTGSVTQRKLVVTNIAEAMSKKWFGYVLYPENWRHQWVIYGLSSYVAYDIARTFQTNAETEDESLLDMNTIFTTDVIQESLLLDAYTSAQPIESSADIVAENSIRLHMHGLIKYKAPALLRMFRLILGNENVDVIQRAARALLSSRSLEPLNSQNFYEAIASVRPDNLLVNAAVDVFMRTWVNNNGYPVVNVATRQGGVILTQERFAFGSVSNVNFLIPITYTTSINRNFTNLRPSMMANAMTTLDFDLLGDGWVLLNLQGQAYYRVNYDQNLWERIIRALEDPERREEIHPLNRAALIDDSLNLARAGRLDYDIAFRIVLTMEHELDYGVWRAYIRNMEFLRKRLIPFVTNNINRDDEIYLRMLRRTIVAVEEQIGFSPENALTEPAMQSLTRGLVMEHACRSGYDPCIAAAVDLFYSPSDPTLVNPNIPRAIRPAVYCTMVRDGEDDVREALLARMELEPSKYERLVILEALACSQDSIFIQTYLEETVAANSPYVAAEKLKIFEAVASSSVGNARLALNFLTSRVNDIRNGYGGPEKLEEAIFILADNMITIPLSGDFNVWVNSMPSISNLGDSNLAAVKARNMIVENMAWNANLMEEAYDWIDLNGAPTIIVSTFLISLSFIIAVINY